MCNPANPDMDLIAKIELDWKSGNLSNVKIAARHAVTEGYVRKLVKLYAWRRGTPLTTPPTPPIAQAELRRPPPVIPPAAHHTVAATRTAPPTDNREYSEQLLRRMLDELDAITSHIGEIEEMIEQETANDRSDQRRIAMMRAVSLPVRADTLRKLLVAQNTGAGPAAKVGKKEQQDDAARHVATGRFAPAPAPLQVVGRK